MISRKNFIHKSIIMGAGITLGVPKMSASVPENNEMPTLPSMNPEADEKYWAEIAGQYIQSGDYRNLENGYFSPVPVSTWNSFLLSASWVNSRTSWFMRNEQEGVWEKERTALSSFLGVTSEELAFTRNTTESMNIIISGYPWKEGDEVIIGNQDYGSMTAAFMQASRRFGIAVKTADVPLWPESDDQIVSAYMNLVTPRTRVIHLTHLINLTGQVIPVAKICRKAHENGIEVMVDAAHSNAQLNFTLPELEADYIGASLHKWLCCPLGTGYLWVKKDKIAKIWPLMADSDFPEDNIKKFEHQGTRPVHSWQCITPAIEFHNKIGSELIEKRLKYLMKIWCGAVARTEGIQILTPWDNDQRNSAIACVAVNGMTPESLQQTLLKRYNIYTVAINHNIIKGVRITPHLFSPVSHVHALAAALKEIAESMR